ncbi:MAG: hypothetical protein ACLQK8_17000 [Streptosporangiaceae bacterium]
MTMVGDFKKLQLELRALSEFIRPDLKRSNIENPELARIAGAVRKMQALLGVYRQSKAHIRTMESYLELNGILLEAAA